jgi:hypothetical protein
LPVENLRPRRASAPITEPHQLPATPVAKSASTYRPLTTGPIDPSEGERIDGAGVNDNGAEEDDASISATAPLPFLSPSSGTTAALIMAGSPMALNAETPAQMELSSRARRRLLLRVVLVAMALGLVADIFYWSPLTDPAANQTPRTLGTIPLAEVHPYGVNTFLHKEVDAWKREQTIEMAQEMGAGWIKQQFPWAEIEYRQNPNDPFWDVKNNQSAWGKFDEIVRLAEQNGLRVIARIDSVPAWARTNDAQQIAKLKEQGLDPAKAPPLDDKMGDFGNFIGEFVKRYRGRVAAIQVWNEPNLKGEWATGNPVNPAEYVELLKVAYEAAKGVDPNVVILAAPLATNNERLEFAGNQNELEYLDGMYRAGAKPYFDAMSANAYGTEFPPEDPPSTERLNFRRVELLHDVMVKNGDDKKAVWFNEYGWNASPPSMPKERLIWGRVTDQQQAEYTVGGIEYAREHWPWAGAFTIWYLRQVGDIAPSASEYYFGLVNPDFVPSQAYRAVQAVAQKESRVATPGEWGPLSAPMQVGPRWQMYLAGDGRGRLVLTPTGPGDTLDLTFLGTDIKMEFVPVDAKVEVSSARYYVTVDGGTQHIASELPRDTSGRAYIEVDPNGQAREVTLVRGLGAQFATGKHTLEISVDGSDTENGQGGGGVFSPLTQRANLPGIGTVKVEANRSYILFWSVAAGLLAGIALLWRILRKSKRT